MTLAPLHPEVGSVLSVLLERQRVALEGDLVGVYLFGSAATGAFEPGISDVDTVVVLRSDLDPRQLSELAVLHRDVASSVPAWDNRIEAVYLSQHALSSFRTGSWPAVRISPGEPFHAIRVDHRWLIDWYQLRVAGLALHGPPPAEVVPEISKSEYVQAVRQHLLDPDWLDVPDEVGSRAYVVLTMCRGLHTWRTGGYLSKREAAAWTRSVLPEHTDVIEGALAWRSGSHVLGRENEEPNDDLIRGFVSTVQSLVEEEEGDHQP